MSKVETYSRGISDAYRLKNALAITLNNGVDFTDDALLNREGGQEGDGQDIHLVSQTESFYFDAKARRATQKEKETAGNLIVEVKVNIPGGKTEKRHYLITNLTQAKVLTEGAAERVLMRSNYFVLGSQDKRRVLAQAHNKHYAPQTLKSLMSDSDGLKLVQKGGKTYSLFTIIFGFTSSLFGKNAPKVLTQEVVQAKNALIAQKKAYATEEVMADFRKALADNNSARLSLAITVCSNVPEAIIRNLTSAEVAELRSQLSANPDDVLTTINNIQTAIEKFDAVPFENLHQELAPSRAIGLWVLQSLILLGVGLILLGVVSVTGTGIVFGAFTLTSPAGLMGLLLLVGIVAPGLPGYLLKSGGAILRFIGALGALLYQAVGNSAYDIQDGVEVKSRGFVRFFVLPVIVVPIAFALNLPVALVSKQSPFSKIEIHNTRALVENAPAYSKGKEINLYHGLARFYTWSAKTLVIAVSIAIFALCIASLFVPIPQLIPILTVAADVLGCALLPFTFGLVTGPDVVSFIVPLLVAGPTSIILVAIFALGVAAIVSYVWWKSLRRGINDARSNPEAALAKAKAVVEASEQQSMQTEQPKGRWRSFRDWFWGTRFCRFVETKNRSFRDWFWETRFGRFVETNKPSSKRALKNAERDLTESRIAAVEDTKSNVEDSHTNPDQGAAKKTRTMIKEEDVEDGGLLNKSVDESDDGYRVNPVNRQEYYSDDGNDRAILHVKRKEKRRYHLIMK